jgi:hypothetical protein
MNKSHKITQMTKKDKQHIIKILDDAFTNNITSCTGWIDALQKIDKEVIIRSLSQILNSSLDLLPQKLIDSNPKLLLIQKTRTITIMDVLENAKTMFRFAPSPSGYLHIGHMIPILLNILLMSISKKYSNNDNKMDESNIVFRIDDTNPSEDDFSANIETTMRKIMGCQYDNMIKTRSSDYAPKIIDMIGDSIIKGDNKFYVDLTDQITMHKERVSRVENDYRKMCVVEQQELWKNVLLMLSTSAVVRAKIDMNSDNGNLRDPVVLRFVCKNGVMILMPTYDLVCPVLDSLDSMNDDTIMIALRDCNYYNRLEQYSWIQNALNIKPTAVVTFSRVNFENTLLSKRKIKKLIDSGYVNAWDDFRLMTIEGMFNRGMTLMGFIQFYWLSGHMSVGNRATSQDIATLFAINDNVLSRGVNFIVDRKPVNFEIVDNYDSYMVISIKICVNNETKGNNDDLIPDVVDLGNVFSLKTRLITDNLKCINELIKKYNLNQLDLDNGLVLIAKYDLSADHFKTCDDIKIGDTIKINNFKELCDEPIFGKYYKVVSKDKCMVNNNNFDRINVVQIS